MKRLLLPVLVLCAACTSPAPPADSAAQAPAAATITTTSSSPEAVAQLRKGEQLLDNLRVAEASEAFAQALSTHRPRLYITNSTLHNPTGAMLSPVVAHRVLNLPSNRGSRL